MHNIRYFGASLCCLVLLAASLTGCFKEEPEASQAEAQPGEINTGSEVTTMENFAQGLQVEYELQHDRRVISGSVLNNTNQPYVNVQVGFDLLDSQGARVGTARDTTSEVQAGNIWQFSANIPPNTAVSRVELRAVQGQPRNVVGPQADPAYMPTDSTRVHSPTDFNRVNPGTPRDYTPSTGGQQGQ